MAGRTKKPEETVILQAYGKEVDVAKLIARAKQEFIDSGHSASEIKSVNIYLKHEDIAAYFVINEAYAGRVSMF